MNSKNYIDHVEKSIKNVFVYSNVLGHLLNIVDIVQGISTDYKYFKTKEKFSISFFN